MEIVYDPLLIVLSVLVAILASFAALNLAYSVTQARGREQVIWLGTGSLALGVGIWSMHFIGMLAWEMPGMEMAYDIPLMITSVAVAIIGSGLALFVVSRPVVHKSSVVLGGIFMAAAISGMHYIGMYSMRMAAIIEWNYLLVAASILIALVASFAALMICIRLRNKPEKHFLLLLASILMGFAIAGMHYTGMLAATFIHDHNGIMAIRDSNLLVSSGLTFTTIGSTVLILGLALVGSIGQRILSVRQKRSDEILGTSEKRYRVLVEAVRDYGIFMLDPEGYITTWNVGAERMTGYSQKEIIGKHVSTLYPPEAVNSSMASDELQTAKEHGHFEGEALRIRKNGSTFWVNIVLDPLFDQKGQITGFSKVVRDITESKESSERTRNLNEELEKRVRERTLALQARETQLRTITNAIPILVAQFDYQENILFANDSFWDWFNRKKDPNKNLKFIDFLGADRYPANKIHIDKVLAGEIVSYERESPINDEKGILSITLVPEFDFNKRVKGFIVVATDVSNYKEIEAQLKRAKEDAEVANETKSAFLANMSHEIRTPLGAVIGFSELILDDEMPQAEKANTIEIIKRNGKLLSTIINDILDLSKVEAGKLEFEKIDVKLLDLMNEISVFLNLEASGKGLQLTVTSEGVIPSTIKTDPTRLRQILFNVVGNAIKFTDKGSISLKVKLYPNDPAKIAFIVQDTGAGITAEQASRLFSPFTQADVTTTRKFGGTGLGLVLSKKFAKALGGDVVLSESSYAQGSTFTITIDHGQSQEVLFNSLLSKESVNPSPGSASNIRNTDLSNLNILVVDDSPDNLSLIKRILNLSGAQVETANNGREGVEKALLGNYHVILMDLQMPEMDGHEATRLLREKKYTGPIIALTAHAMKEERKRCLESGFNEHLTKPIDRGILIKTLSELTV